MKLTCTLCAQVDADLWGTAKFVDSVRLPYIAPSLGGVDSLIEQPTVISYWDQVTQLPISVLSLAWFCIARAPDQLLPCQQGWHSSTPKVLHIVRRGRRREQSMASRTISSDSAADWRVWRTSGGIWCRRWKLWGDMADLHSCLQPVPALVIVVASIIAP